MVGSEPGRMVDLCLRRRELLRRLRRGPGSKRELVDALAVSRSTVDRAVRELQEAGLVRRSADGVELTLLGRLALDRFEEACRCFDGLVRARGVLGPLPAGVDIEPSVFHGASVVEAAAHEPYRPVERLTELIADADRVRGFAAALVPEAITAYHDGLLDGDLDIEFVLTEDVLEGAIARYTEMLDVALESGLRAYRTVGDRPPYNFVVLESGGEATVAVTVYADGGWPGLVENDSDAAVSWARERYEALRREAERVSG